MTCFQLEHSTVISTMLFWKKNDTLLIYDGVPKLFLFSNKKSKKSHKYCIWLYVIIKKTTKSIPFNSKNIASFYLPSIKLNWWIHYYSETQRLIICNSIHQLSLIIFYQIYWSINITFYNWSNCMSIVRFISLFFQVHKFNFI